MNRGKRIAGICLVLGLTLLAACAPKAAQAPAPQARSPAAPPTPVPAIAIPKAPAKAAWQIEWEKVLAEAQKEGTLALYVTFGAQPRQVITSAFKSKYGIRVESMSHPSASELVPKFSAERRAGIYSGDVYVGGGTLYRNFSEGMLDSVEPALILPELTSPELIKKTWFYGELNWTGKAHTTLSTLIRPGRPIGINSKLVKRDEITSYRDLLDPKWKGKMSLQDPQISGMGNMWFTAVLEAGDVDNNYMRELTKQDLMITRDRRLQAEWLARGKHAIAIALQTAAEAEFVQAGAPVDRINLGIPWVSGGDGTGIALLNRAPHPNAAKLFINWLLSQEGQTIHSQAIGTQSQRLDVSTNHIEPSLVLKPGLKVYNIDTEEFATKRVTVYTDLAKQIFGSVTR